MILSNEQVQRRCDYCDDDGMVEMDNNGPIGTCPVCQGTKRLRGASNEPPADWLDSSPAVTGEGGK